MSEADDFAGEQPKLLVPLSGEQLLTAMRAPNESAWELREKFKQLNRRQLLIELAKAYRAYARKPDAPGRVFAAMRALVKACRAHDMTAGHAAMLALMGQIGEGAIAPVKLTFIPRPQTRAMRQREHKQDKRRDANRLACRNEAIFRQVMFHTYENARDGRFGAFNDAFEPVGEQFGLSEESVRKIFQAEARKHRREGAAALVFERGDEMRVVPLPRGPGRPPNPNGRNR